MARQISLTSTSDLRQKGQTVLNVADEFKNTLSQASQNVDAICDNWQDDNGKRYREKFDELATVFSSCNANLQAMGALLNKEADELDEMLAVEQQQLNGTDN